MQLVGVVEVEEIGVNKRAVVQKEHNFYDSYCWKALSISIIRVRGKKVKSLIDEIRLLS